eukprot:GDKJ01004217.1.p1 GENE.GDKJ01004217.1~~GDKJ01004217.1.p1  ORF type:complete len:870 (-),score=157.51 GDKJ01004217.1:71-2680(-)
MLQCSRGDEKVSQFAFLYLGVALMLPWNVIVTNMPEMVKYGIKPEDGNWFSVSTFYSFASLMILVVMFFVADRFSLKSRIYFSITFLAVFLSLLSFSTIFLTRTKLLYCLGIVCATCIGGFAAVAQGSLLGLSSALADQKYGSRVLTGIAFSSLLVIFIQASVKALRPYPDDVDPSDPEMTDFFRTTFLIYSSIGVSLGFFAVFMVRVLYKVRFIAEESRILDEQSKQFLDNESEIFEIENRGSNIENSNDVNLEVQSVENNDNFSNSARQLNSKRTLHIHPGFLTSPAKVAGALSEKFRKNEKCEENCAQQEEKEKHFEKLFSLPSQNAKNTKNMLSISHHQKSKDISVSSKMILSPLASHPSQTHYPVSTKEPIEMEKNVVQPKRMFAFRKETEIFDPANPNAKEASDGSNETTQSEVIDLGVEATVAADACCNHSPGASSSSLTANHNFLQLSQVEKGHNNPSEQISSDNHQNVCTDVTAKETTSSGETSSPPPPNRSSAHPLQHLHHHTLPQTSLVLNLTLNLTTLNFPRTSAAQHHHCPSSLLEGGGRDSSRHSFNSSSTFLTHSSIQAPLFGTSSANNRACSGRRTNRSVLPPFAGDDARSVGQHPSSAAVGLEHFEVSTRKRLLSTSTPVPVLPPNMPPIDESETVNAAHIISGCQPILESDQYQEFNGDITPKCNYVQRPLLATVKSVFIPASTLFFVATITYIIFPQMSAQLKPCGWFIPKADTSGWMPLFTQTLFVIGDILGRVLSSKGVRFPRTWISLVSSVTVTPLIAYFFIVCFKADNKSMLYHTLWKGFSVFILGLWMGWLGSRGFMEAIETLGQKYPHELGRSSFLLSFAFVVGIFVGCTISPHVISLIKDVKK